MPGSGGVAHRTPDDLRTGRLPLAPLAALSLAAVWMILAPRTPDLAAQVYRVELFDHTGFAVWDERWYAGHDLPGYSLLLGPLASLLGLRLLALLSTVASAVLFERLALRCYGAPARSGALWFAVAAVGDIWIGRVTFAVGVPFALAAVLALLDRRPSLAALLAALSAAASPVAGALLGLAALTRAVTPSPHDHPAGAPDDPQSSYSRRTPFAYPRRTSFAGSLPSCRSSRALLLLAVPAAAVVLSTTLLFPEDGHEPFPAVSFAVTVIVTVAFLLALPPGQTLLRNGAIVFLLACLLCLSIPSPIGSNVERYAVLLAGPLLLCARASAGGKTGNRPARGLGRTPGVAAVLCLVAVWIAWGPVRETLAVAGEESTKSSYYAPVKRFLASRGGDPVRIEVPLTRSHWEAALLASSVSLARGWEKQLDERFDHVLLDPGLTAAAYSRWLREQAVAYVALPDATLDPSSAQEGRLIRGGLAYLSEVFSSAHWRIYTVRSPTPIAAGPGRLVSLGHDSFALRASSAGSFLVRVRFTRYFTVTKGSACVSPARGGWTTVRAGAAGEITVVARFSLARALGVSGACVGASSRARPPHQTRFG